MEAFSHLKYNIVWCIWALEWEEITEYLVELQESGAKGWLFAVAKSPPHEELTRVLVTLWTIISYARRKAIYEDIFLSRSAVQPRWTISPPAGLLNINVDTAVSKNSGALAVEVRDSVGIFQGACNLV